MSEPWVIIMAGGSGTRFWPASRRAKPKQFLRIGGGEPLLRATYDRIAPLAGPDRCLVVCGRSHAEPVQSMLPELPSGAILAEPMGRNTAPCIAWAVRTLLDGAPDAPVAILPADHYVPDAEALRAALRQAFQASADRIVLFGIVPTAPETGYGYIEVEGRAQPGVAQSVLGFREKPDRDTAEQLLATGRYVWNSGMFIGRVQTLWDQIRVALPEVAEGIERIHADPHRLDAVYPELTSVSFDHGVLEKSQDLVVMPLQCAWSDVGSWPAVYELFRETERSNVTVQGEVEVVDAEGCLFDVASGRTLAVVGVRDLVVVDTSDAVLVADRQRAQEVKKVVERLRAKGREDLL